MALTQVTGPYPIFTDLDGTPLDDGYLYVGEINQDPEQNPIQVFFDAALTIPATQPIRTNNGYAYRNGTPALLYTAGEFSITIRNKRNEFVLYSPVGYGFDPAAVSASVVKNDFVGDGVEVDFTLSSAPSTILATNVFINGVYQEKDSYTLSGNVITFSIAPPLNSSIEIMTNETGVINSGNATAITYTLTAAGAIQQTVQTKLEQYVSVDDFGAIPDGTTDSGPAIRTALASGLPLRFSPGTYIVGPDPASENTGGIGPGLFGWCIQVPDNTTMIFDEGSIIKGANGLKSWCRVMQFGTTDNIKVFGEMIVDANVANIGSPNNEHMHGVFLFDATNFYFDAIKSINARGDNVYIGGTDNTRGSCDGYIGRIVAETAGRKNLVWQAFDNVNIGSASLDNVNGGAAIYGGSPDGTDGNCFDVEPDALPTIANRGTINYLYTKGAGNDFTAGITESAANNVIVSIGKWDCVIVPRSTTAWYTQYALTLNIDEWNVSGITAVCPQANIFYAARLNVQKCTISGATVDVNTALMLISTVGTDRPVCTFDSLQITATQGVGFEVRSGQVTIDYYRARTAGLALWARELGSTASLYTDVKIGKLDLLNIGVPLGASYAVLLSKGATNVGYLHIDQIVHQDTRTPDLNSIVYTSGAGASAGLYIGSVVNLTPAVAVQGGDAADIYYSTAANALVSVNDPEGSVVAPVGSIASWFGNGLYKKDTGTGNTGWVAL